jgi:predicted DNA-binding transcriptional regulator YafY
MNLLIKIKSVLKNSDKELLVGAHQHIEVLQNEFLLAARSELLNIKQTPNAILHKQIIRIKYFTGSRFESTEREIEPIEIFSVRANWHLISWYRLSEDYRNFRLTRFWNWISITNVLKNSILSSKHSSKKPNKKKT